MSTSYHFDDSLAEVAKVWWLLCSSSPPIKMPNGMMLVADAVDDAGRRHRDPHHLHGPHGDADGAEQDHVQHQQADDALPAVFGVQIALDPVRRRAVAVFLHRF